MFSYRPISSVTSHHVTLRTGGQASVCLQHGGESDYEARVVTRLFWKSTAERIKGKVSRKAQVYRRTRSVQNSAQRVDQFLLEVSNNTSFRDFGNFISQPQFHVYVVLHDLSRRFSLLKLNKPNYFPVERHKLESNNPNGQSKQRKYNMEPMRTPSHNK